MKIKESPKIWIITVFLIGMISCFCACKKTDVPVETESENIMSTFSMEKKTETPMETEKTILDADDLVRYFYQEILDREADETGIKDWVSGLEEHRLAGCDLAYGLVFSAECQERCLDDESYIRMLYKALLGREGDQNGVDNWFGALQNGITRDQMFFQFALSDEFHKFCEAYGVESIFKYVNEEEETFIRTVLSAIGPNDFDSENESDQVIKNTLLKMLDIPYVSYETGDYLPYTVISDYQYIITEYDMNMAGEAIFGRGNVANTAEQRMGNNGRGKSNEVVINDIVYDEKNIRVQYTWCEYGTAEASNTRVPTKQYDQEAVFVRNVGKTFPVRLLNVYADKAESERNMEEMRKETAEQIGKEWLDIYVQCVLDRHVCETELLDQATADDALLDMYGLERDVKDGVIFRMTCCHSLEEAQNHRLEYFSEAILEQMNVPFFDTFKVYEGYLYGYIPIGRGGMGFPEESFALYTTDYSKEIKFQADLINSGGSYISTYHFVLTKQGTNYKLTSLEESVNPEKEGKSYDELY